MLRCLSRLAVCVSGMLVLSSRSCQGNPEGPGALLDHQNEPEVSGRVTRDGNTHAQSHEPPIGPHPRGPSIVHARLDVAVHGKKKIRKGLRRQAVGLVPVPAAGSTLNRTAVLERHNMYRAQHGAPPLQLNETINTYAQAWADHLASTQQFSHRPKSPYGENLYMAWGRKKPAPSPYAAVDVWYNEAKHYSYAHPAFSVSTGHFTQVVWKGTRQLGVGVATASNGAVYVVCSYSPPGNYLGQFAQNVVPSSTRRPGTATKAS